MAEIFILNTNIFPTNFDIISKADGLVLSQNGIKYFP